MKNKEKNKIKKIRIVKMKNLKNEIQKVDQTLTDIWSLLLPTLEDKTPMLVDHTLDILRIKKLLDAIVNSLKERIIKHEDKYPILVFEKNNIIYTKDKRNDELCDYIVNKLENQDILFKVLCPVSPAKLKKVITAVEWEKLEKDKIIRKETVKCVKLK